MSKAIATSEISKPYLEFDPDNIWSDKALANAGTITSDEFKAGFDQGGVEVVVEAATAISIADAQTLTVNLLHSATSGGTATTVQIAKFAPSGGTQDFAIDEKIVQYIPGEIGPFCKLAIVTSADESSEKVNAYLRYVSR